jgi:hypothetical protein
MKNQSRFAVICFNVNQLIARKLWLVAAIQGISRSELIRRAICCYFDSHSSIISSCMLMDEQLISQSVEEVLPVIPVKEQ